MRKIIPLIFSVLSSFVAIGQANGGWGTCEFTTVAAMNAFDPSGSNFSCKKVYVQATDEHYQWNGTIWERAASLENIYTSDDTLTANRTVTMDGKKIVFDGTRDVVIQDNGRVGIGSDTSSSAITILNEANSHNDDDIEVMTYNTGADYAPALILKSARGSYASPLNSSFGDRLGRIAFYNYYNSSGFGRSTYIESYYKGNGTNIMSDLRIGTSGSDAMYIDSIGDVGIGTVDPDQKLDVRGTIIGAVPCIAVAMSTDDSDNVDSDVMGLMVASVPSTNHVWVKSIQDRDNTSASGLQNESNWTNGAGGGWNDFGDPSGGAAGYIMDISISIEFGGNADQDDFGGVITVRWSNGTIYVLSTDNNTLNDTEIDDLANWGASWSSWNGPGM